MTDAPDRPRSPLETWLENVYHCAACARQTEEGRGVIPCIEHREALEVLIAREAEALRAALVDLSEQHEQTNARQCDCLAHERARTLLARPAPTTDGSPRP